MRPRGGSRQCRALNGLGVALSVQGHAADANATLARALALDPQNGAVQNNLAIERIAAGDAKGAIALLTADTAQASPTSVMNLALAHLMLRNEAAARGFSRRISPISRSPAC